VRYDTTANESYYYIDSESVPEQRADEEGGNLGYKVGTRAGTSRWRRMTTTATCATPW